MDLKKLVRNNEKTVLLISQVIIIGFLITNILVFIDKDSIIAKSLAAASFIGFLFFLIMTLRANSKTEKH
ncbi:Na+/proline symporter [Metabacillus crassostreae]|uniref:hypothetical protein n=1 Tax=Metabacillus crassostreae TaxID=929098 RepID=UPI00195A7062|nr:hypothetical protein [Metabacillus crassostreae]MBM7602441.1 Na+/proline symporter [Metabacillus crassostreae]